ncbi:hypothetical protein GQ457_13G018340 [Hibiscus cannabinus]
MVPTCFRFCPTDEELIESCIKKYQETLPLLWRLSISLSKEIYTSSSRKSQLSDIFPTFFRFFDFFNDFSSSVACMKIGSESIVGLNKNETYFYCKRESDSREVMGRGWWKATSHVKAISSSDGELIGYKRPLTFHRFKDDNQRNRKAAIKTDWIMHEYKLHSISSDDNQRNRKAAIKTDWIMHEYKLHSISSDWRLCKIKYKGKEKPVEVMISMEDTFGNNMTTPSLCFEAEGGGGGSSSSVSTNITRMQLEVALEQPPSLPVNENLNCDNYCWSNSNMIFHDGDGDDDLFADQLDTLSEQPFSDLWSWNNCCPDQVFSVSSFTANHPLVRIGPMTKKSISQLVTPPHGLLKFNIDRAISRSFGPSGIGSIISNEIGFVLIYFSKPSVNLDLTSIEILAIKPTCSLLIVSKWLELRYWFLR